MGLLRKPDLRRLHDVTAAVERPTTWSQLPELVVDSLSELVSAEAIDYREIDLRDPHAMRSASQPPLGARGGLEAVLERLLPTHPLFVHFTSAGSGQATRFSDLIGLRDLKRLDIYQEFYRPLGFDRFLAALLPGPPDVMIAVSFGRGGRDFTDTDRQLLDLIRPHLAHARQATQDRDWINAATKALEFTDVACGVVLLGPHGLVSFANAAARAMLSAYCRRGCREGQVLPEELTSWLAAQQRRSTADRPRPPQPYVATRNGAHLVVEWISGDASGALLLTEAVNSDYGLIPKVATLTRRETEVLWLVAHGHKNAAIARRLGIGPRTVEHHLANTYQKLGVHSRTEAMLHAFGTRLPLPARRPGDTGLKDSAVG